MKSFNLNTKRTYKSPTLEQIQIDNEISLALESTPPFPGDEFLVDIPDQFNNNLV